MVPRVLFCLHVFCEHCLDKKMIGEGGDAGTAETTITCPTCNQDTKVSVIFNYDILLLLLHFEFEHIELDFFVILKRTCITLFLIIN